MIVFLALHIDTREVRERIREWRMEDKESGWIRGVFGHFPISERARKIGSLPGRFAMVFIPILIILIPLSQSFSQLRQEITHQQRENRIRQAASEVWKQNFGNLASGEPRSYIDQLSVSEQEGRLALYLRVFTSKPCSAGERAEYTRLVSSRLATPPQAIALQLVEVPTASGNLTAKAREERPVEAPPSVAQLQTSFLKGIESALEGLRLPQPARLVSYRVMTSPDDPIDIMASYVSDHEIDLDGQLLIAEDIKTRLDFPEAKVKLIWIEESFGPVAFGRNRALLGAASAAPLDRAASILQQHPTLGVEVNTGREEGEREEVASERAQAIADYLASKWNISRERISSNTVADVKRSAILKVKHAKQ
jgi:outer membrane protein OmpA-like peptidoglycan-associated protein